MASWTLMIKSKYLKFIINASAGIIYNVLTSYQQFIKRIGNLIFQISIKMIN